MAKSRTRRRTAARGAAPRRPQVSIVMGSDSDWPVLESAASVLETFQVPCEVRVLSAHRSPESVRRHALEATRRGVKVFIAAAGGAAHLGGVIAAYTSVPVIGIPVGTKALGGLDSLLSTVQMPRGVPVATVAIGNATNAALLAIQILALSNPALGRRLAAYKRGLGEKTVKADRSLQRRLKGV